MSEEILLQNDEFVPAQLLADRFPLKVDLHQAYADHPWNLFAQPIYHPTASLWLHKDLAQVVAIAALNGRRQHGWTLVVHDSLRPVEAQALMAETDIVKANPQWLQEPRLLSPPGKGAHPRGMAVDVTVLDRVGQIVDMGTHMDQLTAGDNLNARNYRGFSAEILNNRQQLEALMVEAGKQIGRPVMPLANEWWDFRFYPDDTNRFAPLAEDTLPAYMQMTKAPEPIPEQVLETARKLIDSFEL